MKKEAGVWIACSTLGDLTQNKMQEGGETREEQSCKLEALHSENKNNTRKQVTIKKIDTKKREK